MESKPEPNAVELRRFKAIVDSSDDAIIGKTLDGIITSWNRGAEKIFGYSAKEAIGHPMNMLIPLDRPNEEAEILEKLSRGERIEHFETVRRCKDGRFIEISTTISPIHDENGKVIGASKIARDITERKLVEEKLHLYASVFSGSYEGIIVTDADRLIIDANPAFTRITGFTLDEVFGKSPKLLSSGRHDAAFYAAMLASLEENDFWCGEIWNRRKDGEIYSEMLAITTVRDPAGRLKNYIGVFSDISFVKAHESELERIAHYDALTGVPNRHVLFDRLNQAIARTRRSGKILAVCFLDLDGFKQINDHYGHAAGDDLLVAMTRRLGEILRAEDTMIRFGGDEFALFFTDLAKEEDAHVILNRILIELRAPVLLRATAVTISASIGVTFFPGDADADTLIRHADKAMYEAKKKGKNRYSIFNLADDVA